ncbi:MAG: hypothetical protein R2785_04135 [Flavobacteriaceae bacterium]
MKTKFIFFAALVLLFNCTNENVTSPEDQACDNGTYVGDVILTTQQEVEDFGTMCYSKIDGKLQIGVVFDNDIVDLSPLSNLKEVFSISPTDDLDGFIHIYKANNLISLNGLNNLVSVGGLSISNCNGLTTLQGLESLTYINNFSRYNFLKIINNQNLENFNGLNNLLQIGISNDIPFTGLYFSGNPLLSNIDALSNLEKVYGVIRTYHILNFESIGNNSLADFCGLENLFSNGVYNINGLRIEHNAYNPTVQDIIDGNCSQ